MATSTPQPQVRDTATARADAIFASCLMCPVPEMNRSEWSRMLWTLAFLDTETEIVA